MDIAAAYRNHASLIKCDRRIGAKGQPAVRLPLGETRRIKRACQAFFNSMSAVSAGSIHGDAWVLLGFVETLMRLALLSKGQPEQPADPWHPNRAQAAFLRRQPVDFAGCGA